MESTNPRSPLPTPVRSPGASYRLQFTGKFRFRDALGFLPYLRDLGVRQIYASPVTLARPGSDHGYDVCDPQRLNPELGTMEEFERLVREARALGLSWTQDIVPNHMAFTHKNPYLADVMEHGRHSRFADWFDIGWDHQYPSLQDRLLAPFLAKPYGQCLVDRDLHVVWEEGGLWVAHGDQRYPLAPETYAMALADEAEGFHSLPDSDSDDLRLFQENLVLLRDLTEVADPPRRFERCHLGKATLRDLLDRSSTLRSHLADRLRDFAAGTPASIGWFDAMLARQHYRLAHWRTAYAELNYRRFFAVNELISMQVEKPEVFEATHGFLVGLVDQGLVTGFRIDHIDGLNDPSAYLHRLRERVPEAYLVVEKILEREELIPEDWPVQGTSGYEALNHLDGILCDRRSLKRLSVLYNSLTGGPIDAAVLEMDKKRLIIGNYMAGDIDNLAHLVVRIAGADLMGRDLTLSCMRRALIEVLAHFPVYRTYVTGTTFSATDARRLAQILTRARQARPDLAVEFEFIERFLMMRGDEVLHGRHDDAWKAAVMRFQQFTGPLMAKGCEDTFFYVYNRCAVLNEVGGWPLHFGVSDEEFHRFQEVRASCQSQSMNASSTHDTKRGEDTRARLLVLTELPVEWGEKVVGWRKSNARHHPAQRGAVRLDPNDEYMFYQTIAGTLREDGVVDEPYRERIHAYMIKAVCEAKIHTNWDRHDEEYEAAVRGFVSACLDPETGGSFLESMRGFVARIAWHGKLNSLSRTILKCTLPGVPDFYQGTEWWDFSLVDPDNRRPVDLSIRRRALQSLPADARIPPLVEGMGDDATKQALTRLCLQARLGHAELFAAGDYAPLAAKGARRRNLVAFVRSHGGRTLLVVAPRFTTELVGQGVLPLGPGVWKDTRIRVPKALARVRLRDILAGREIEMQGWMAVADLLTEFPGAIFLPV